MTQSEINCAVSRVLGEDIRDIDRRGFTLVGASNPFDEHDYEELRPQVLDWDAGPYADSARFLDEIA